MKVSGNRCFLKIIGNGKAKKTGLETITREKNKETKKTVWNVIYTKMTIHDREKGKRLCFFLKKEKENWKVAWKLIKPTSKDRWKYNIKKNWKLEIVTLANDTLLGLLQLLPLFLLQFYFVIVLKPKKKVFAEPEGFRFLRDEIRQNIFLIANN